MISLEAYGFQLPKKLIAQKPLDPPDQSRLLYSPCRGAPAHTTTLDLPGLLPPRSLLVANNTKVMKSRLSGKRVTGGELEILLAHPESSNRWWALVRGKLKEGEEFFIEENKVHCLQKNGNGLYLLDIKNLDIFSLMKKYGELPLPPYISRLNQQEDETWYQTSFAQEEGAVAAPTAGLHFSEKLRGQIQERGHSFETITLHVGPGTFLPVRVNDPLSHRVMKEKIQVSQETWNKILDHKKKGYPVIAIGTTVARTLETLARRFCDRDYVGWVDLTVTPPFRFRVVDHLLTNFHLPKSSLFLLISAFAGRKRALEAYQDAIEKEYRFYSYGDLTFFE